jgi:hypothetical protein
VPGAAVEVRRKCRDKDDSYGGETRWQQLSGSNCIMPKYAMHKPNKIVAS